MCHHGVWRRLFLAGDELELSPDCVAADTFYRQLAGSRGDNKRRARPQTHHTCRHSSRFGRGGIGSGHREGSSHRPTEYSRLVRAVSSHPASRMAWGDCDLRHAGDLRASKMANAAAVFANISSAPCVRLAWLARSYYSRSLADLLQRTFVPASHLVLARPMAIGRLAKHRCFRFGFRNGALARHATRIFVCGNPRAKNRCGVCWNVAEVAETIARRRGVADCCLAT